MPAGRDEFAELDERSVVPRIQAGDAEAFLALYRVAHPVLVPFASQIAQSREVGEDAVQSVFLSIWVNREQWEPRVGLRPYLFRAVRNKVLKSARHGEVVRRAESGVDVEAPYGMGVRPVAADEALESADMVHVVAAAIRRLPERQRTAMELYWYDEMTTAAIAVVMGVSRQAVEKLLRTAEARLAVILENRVDR